MRFLTAGESHGPGLTAIIEGLPAGLPIDPELINAELAQRQKGAGRGGRMRIETDQVIITSGLRFGYTSGSPLCLTIHNRDWVNWERTMNPLPVENQPEPVTQPRPGHADLAGVLKYGFTDCRNVLERASARETAARVAVGAVAKQLLAQFGIVVASQVIRIGTVETSLRLGDPSEIELVRRSPVACLDHQAAERMVEEITEAGQAGDTLGGIFEVVAWGVPPGLGSHVHWDRRLDTRLAAALMSIPAIKGVEIGTGFALAGLRGSAAHDPICYASETGYYRTSNHAGGLEGGITNGMPLRMTAAMKPIPTLMKPLDSVDIKTKEVVVANRERSDVTAVPAAAVVGEAMVAWIIAEAFAEKFGADQLSEMKAAYERYLEVLRRG